MCTEKIIFMAGNTHEYVAKEGNCDLFCGRAPHGARGLKQRAIDLPGMRHQSRPAWGAWIETLDRAPANCASCVAPRMGRVD